MMRWLAAVAAAFAAHAAVASVQVVDDTGATIALAAPAHRIVTLAPHATEIVFAAGAGDRVVGAVRGSNHPPAAASVPVVGDVHAIDLERIVTLKPDLVVTWPYTTPGQVAKLKARGVAVFVTDPPTIDGIATDIERIGALAETGDVAARAAAAFRDRIRRATRAASMRARVFYQIWGGPIFTVGGRHLISQAIEACGGENVFASSAIPAPQVSVEAVIAARPDVIVAGADEALYPAWLDEWKRWPAVPAVREGRLRVVDADRLHRPGPRFADGVAELCDAIVMKR
jgi:iron complex transport system substrate-binding protein